MTLTEVTIAALVGHAKDSVTSKYIHTLDTALMMAADTISDYIQGLLEGVAFKQTGYALDLNSRKAALARCLRRASAATQRKPPRQLLGPLGRARTIEELEGDPLRSTDLV